MQQRWELESLEVSTAQPENCPLPLDCLYIADMRKVAILAEDDGTMMEAHCKGDRGGAEK